ncbi:MAG: hypothetical protein WAT93_13675 [Pontixanthobacter sp.]
MLKKVEKDNAADGRKARRQYRMQYDEISENLTAVRDALRDGSVAEALEYIERMLHRRDSAWSMGTNR